MKNINKVLIWIVAAIATMVIGGLTSFVWNIDSDMKIYKTRIDNAEQEIEACKDYSENVNSKVISNFEKQLVSIQQILNLKEDVSELKEDLRYYFHDLKRSYNEKTVYLNNNFNDTLNL